MNPISNLTPQQLRQAADVQEKILELQAELNQLLGAPAQTFTVANVLTSEGPKKRTFSAASRAKMAQAQRNRWARIKGTTPESTPESVPIKKRRLSDAHLKALAKAREARWGKARAAKKGVEVAAEPEQPAQKPKRKMTAAWKKALSLARESRLAKLKAAKSSAKPEQKPKSRFSPSEKAALSAKLKAYWAKKKAAKK